MQESPGDANGGTIGTANHLDQSETASRLSTQSTKNQVDGFKLSTWPLLRVEDRSNKCGPAIGARKMGSFFYFDNWTSDELKPRRNGRAFDANTSHSLPQSR